MLLHGFSLVSNRERLSVMFVLVLSFLFVRVVRCCVRRGREVESYVRGGCWWVVWFVAEMTA